MHHSRHVLQTLSNVCKNWHQGCRSTRKLTYIKLLKHWRKSLLCGLVCWQRSSSSSSHLSPVASWLLLETESTSSRTFSCVALPCTSCAAWCWTLWLIQHCSWLSLVAVTSAWSSSSLAPSPSSAAYCWLASSSRANMDFLPGMNTSERNRQGCSEQWLWTQAHTHTQQLRDVNDNMFDFWNTWAVHLHYVHMIKVEQWPCMCSISVYKVHTGMPILKVFFGLRLAMVIILKGSLERQIRAVIQYHEQAKRQEWDCSVYLCLSL